MRNKFVFWADQPRVQFRKMCGDLQSCEDMIRFGHNKLFGRGLSDNIRMLWDTDRAGCYQSKKLWQYAYSFILDDSIPVKSVTHIMGLAGTNKGPQDGVFGNVKCLIKDLIMASVGNCVTAGNLLEKLLISSRGMCVLTPLFGKCFKSCPCEIMEMKVQELLPITHISRNSTGVR